MPAASTGATGTGDAGNLDELTMEECLERLRVGWVGRIGVVVDGRPVVLPVNYRLVEPDGADAPLVVLRTRAGGVLDREGPAAFEIDAFDVGSRRGWSVLVQGVLRQVDAEHVPRRAALDPEPFVDDRTSWLLLDGTTVTGRHVEPSEFDWSSDPRGYL